ncbi:uncharacterized protein LOC134209784 [Armigeres subalbatus]|uniref:uncharacterized protein LOC134209784 n=1 Tax=Armigeres subalbatus TaxID=124917 RepID=UPI002ED678EF
MASNDLLEDLPISASALKEFEECGVDTTALICWDKQQISEALLQTNVDWDVETIWDLISNWRSRNGLENAVIVFEDTNSAPQDAASVTEQTEKESSETLKIQDEPEEKNKISSNLIIKYESPSESVDEIIAESSPVITENCSIFTQHTQSGLTLF